MNMPLELTLAWMRRDLLSRGYDERETDAAIDAQGVPESLEKDYYALAIFERLDLNDYLKSLHAMLSSLDALTRQRWRRAFTRTVFVAGSPARLATRFNLELRREDSRTAILPPKEARHYDSHLRLLRLLDLRGAPGGGALEFETASQQNAIDIVIDASRMTINQYLIHLNHLVCDAWLHPSIQSHPATLPSLRISHKLPKKTDDDAFIGHLRFELITLTLNTYHLLVMQHGHL
ncbi:MAG: DUF6182 family protein [Polyangiales bacterium]